MKKLHYKLFFSILFLFFFSSCYGKVDIRIDENNNFDIKYKNNYTQSLYDLVEDFNTILKDEITLYDEDKLDMNIYELSELLEDADDNKLLKVTQLDKQTKEYEININIDNYKRLAKIFPVLEDENVLLYTAKANRDETQESFLQIIDFVFGNEFKTDFFISATDITFSTNGIISDVQNAQVIDEHTISCTISALDFALLKKEIKISFVVNNNNNNNDNQ